MKKRTKVIIGVVVALALVIFIVTKVFGGNKDKQEAELANDGIEYYNVEGVDQVFINGTITPVKSEEFMKDTTLGKLGDLNVKNGDIVEQGALLYQYVDPTSEREITEMKMNMQTTQSERDKMARQKALELKQLSAGAVDEESGESGDTPLNREAIDLKYDLESYDIRLSQMQQQLDEILSRQVNKVTAPFKGKVSIPQEKNRDSAILNLVSEDFYVVGSVNEKDVEKLQVNQPADIKLIASNKSLKGKITYISEIPATASAENQLGGGNQGSLSNYTVKLSIESPVGIKNGFHVQSAITIGDKKITIPQKAVHYDKEQAYVFVDDFGTVLKKNIEVVKEDGKVGKEVVVLSGLEALDRVIVKSDKKLKDGDVLPSAEGGEGEAEAGGNGAVTVERVEE